MTTNYFAVSQDVEGPRGRLRHMEPFFFDDRRPESVRNAFESATSAFLDTEGKKGQMAVYRQPALGGPWDGMHVVGEATSDLGEEGEEPS